MAATENNENAVKETKRNEDYKSPGRLKAEEKAERIRAAEEYRRKLEAENAALPPKKTKAAEQKEQEKIEKAEKELAERKAMLDEQTSSASQRIFDAKEKIEALKDKIERTEAELAAAKESTEAVVKADEACGAKTVEPTKIDGLVIKLPVASFTAPCAVKYRKQKPAPAPAPMMPPMAPPVICITNVIQPSEQKCQAETVKQPQFKTVFVKPSFTFVVPPEAATESAKKSKPFVRAIDVTASFRKNDAYKPAITYGNHLCESGWDDELEDGVLEAVELEAPVSEKLSADNLVSDLERVSENMDSTVSEIEKISEELESALGSEE